MSIAVVRDSLLNIPHSFFFVNKFFNFFRHFFEYVSLKEDSTFVFLLSRKKKDTYYVFKQRYQDSNLKMPESESGALPFGDSAIFYVG